MAARADSDTAKTIFIFWCLFAFIASGFEHSVANMTLLSIAFIADPYGSITPAGIAYNLMWVTIGNVIGGGLFVALGYWFATSAYLRPRNVSAIVTANPSTKIENG
jgi:nitrite transporter NirC